MGRTSFLPSQSCPESPGSPRQACDLSCERARRAPEPQRGPESGRPVRGRRLLWEAEEEGGAGALGWGCPVGMRKERRQSPRVMKRSPCRAWWPREGVAGAPAFTPKPLPSPALRTPLCLPHQPFRASQEPSSFPPRDLRVCLFLELLCTFPCSPAISPQGSPQESPKQVQVLSHLTSGTPVSALPPLVLRSTPQFTAAHSGGASLTALSPPHQPGAQRAETSVHRQVLAAPAPCPEPVIYRCSINTHGVGRHGSGPGCG